MGFNYEQYETVLSKNTTDFLNCDGWSNATGDTADLQAKLSALETNLTYYRGEENQLQGYYDGFNNRTPKNKKESDAKEAGKKEYADKLASVRNNISNTINAISATKADLATEINRVYQAEQKRLADEAIERKRLADLALENARLKGIEDENARQAKIKADKDLADIEKAKKESDAAIELAKTTAKNLADAKAKEQEIKKEIDLKLVDKGVIPEAELKKAELAGQAVVEAAKINATAQAKVTELTGVSTSKTKNYLMIGGFIVLVIGTYLFFRNKSNN